MIFVLSTANELHHSVLYHPPSLPRFPERWQNQAQNCSIKQSSINYSPFLLGRLKSECLKEAHCIYYEAIYICTIHTKSRLIPEINYPRWSEIRRNYARTIDWLDAKIPTLTFREIQLIPYYPHRRITCQIRKQV